MCIFEKERFRFGTGSDIVLKLNLCLVGMFSLLEAVSVNLVLGK